MVGSWSEDRGAELYCLEPSGVSYGYWGCAAGKAKSNAKTELEKLKMMEMNCAELVKEAAKIIYMVSLRTPSLWQNVECFLLSRFTTR